MTVPVASGFDPARHPDLTNTQAEFVRQVLVFTRDFFENPKFDSSHDFNHLMRVVSNAIHILKQEQQRLRSSSESNPNLCAFTVIIGALLHDVDDRKYIDNTSDGRPLAKQELVRLGMSQENAQKIQTLIDGVSYSSEAKNPQHTRAIIEEIPELAIVQDADRLDAIGAVGIARCFTFGGAKRARTLEASIEHFHDKLVKLEGMMKTKTGKELAAERTRRLKEYLMWWQDEACVHAE